MLSNAGRIAFRARSLFLRYSPAGDIGDVASAAHELGTEVGRKGHR
jgi:hypothetical protein